jgi:hypothetical protein
VRSLAWNQYGEQLHLSPLQIHDTFTGTYSACSPQRTAQANMFATGGSTRDGQDIELGRTKVKDLAKNEGPMWTSRVPFRGSTAEMVGSFERAAASCH